MNSSLRVDALVLRDLNLTLTALSLSSVPKSRWFNCARAVEKPVKRTPIWRGEINADAPDNAVKIVI